jgi:hypothetical protein
MIPKIFSAPSAFQKTVLTTDDMDRTDGCLGVCSIRAIHVIRGQNSERPGCATRDHAVVSVD